VPGWLRQSRLSEFLEARFVRKPNFFIIGAPKCGTTSLAHWLSQHAQVFMSTPKELNFFSWDLHLPYRDTLQRYERYFAGAGPQHVAVGEASTRYLRSMVAVQEILKYASDAKFIVGVRNPVDLVVSWHAQMRRVAWEDEPDLRRAWALQAAREQGRRVPPLCHDPQDLLYGRVAKLGEQLARLYAQVPRSQVLIYLLDEMAQDPRALWQKVLGFLGVPDDGRANFPRLNERRQVPWWLGALSSVTDDTKRILGVTGGLGLIQAAHRWLSRPHGQPIPVEFREELVEYFRADILLLGELLGRDLSGWLAVADESAPGQAPAWGSADATS
jgi:hypothetical protein